jgi:hypothetical protein
VTAAASRRLRLLALALVATFFACVTPTFARAAARGRSASPPAGLARILDGSDTAHLRLVRHFLRGDSEALFERGEAKGAIPGEMTAEVEITPTSLSGSCTIKTRDGSTITGEGRATPRGSGRYQSFSGTLTITKGTGRYAQIHGHAGLYGTFDQRSFAMVVQTTGTLSY